MCAQCYSLVFLPATTAVMWAVYWHNHLINRLITTTHLEGKLNGLQISRVGTAARRVNSVNTAVMDNSNASCIGMSHAELVMEVTHLFGNMLVSGAVNAGPDFFIRLKKSKWLFFKLFFLSRQNPPLVVADFHFQMQLTNGAFMCLKNIKGQFLP